ncbi:MAG: hypothetical protein ACRCX2_39145 [Paraclostridium sp.]
MEDYAIMIPVKKDLREGKFKTLGYDKCLKIVLFGDPIADSRPRVMGSGRVAIVNLQKLKAQFKPLYQESELLQNLMIHSHYHIDFKFFMKTTEKDLKFIKKNSTILRRYNLDKLPDLNIKDVDNMVKVHNDLLFSDEYRITLDDAYNIGLIDPDKLTSRNPRTEMLIYFSSKPDAWFRHKMENSAKYFEHMVSYKWMNINKRCPKEQMKYLTKFMDKIFINVVKLPDQVKHIKRLAEVLEEYPADILKEMGSLSTEFRKFNKYDASLKVILLILKKHKKLADALTGLSK